MQRDYLSVGSFFLLTLEHSKLFHKIEHRGPVISAEIHKVIYFMIDNPSFPQQLDTANGVDLSYQIRETI